MFKKMSSDLVMAETDICVLDTGTLGEVKELAKASPRGRARICGHQSGDDLMHEMFIALVRGSYIPPHKHLGKTESFHMIEGKLAIFVLSDEGELLERFNLVAPQERTSMGQSFYYRLSAPKFHVPVPLSEICVFHETTNGPFKREETLFADWAPGEEAGKEEQQAYIANLLSL